MRPPAKSLLSLLLVPACLSGSAHAIVTCTASATNDFSTCNLTENGVTISNFSFTGYTPQAGDKFNLIANLDRSGDLEFDFFPNIFGSGNPTLGPRSGTYSYTITLAPNPTVTYFFDTVTLDPNGNTNAGGRIQTSVSAAGLSPTPQVTITGGTTNSNNGIFSPNITSRTFTQSFSIDPLGHDTTRYNDILTQWDTRTPAPGPLPLLGAATAFGLSRKLRRRIRSAA